VDEADRSEFPAANSIIARDTDWTGVIVIGKFDFIPIRLSNRYNAPPGIPVDGEVFRYIQLDLHQAVIVRKISYEKSAVMVAPPAPGYFLNP
jgi:hypothetical protein